MTVRRLDHPSDLEVDKTASILIKSVGATLGCQAAAAWKEDILNENFLERARQGAESKSIYVIECEGQIAGVAQIGLPGVELPAPWKHEDETLKYEDRIDPNIAKWQKEQYFPWYKVASERGFGVTGTKDTLYVGIIGVDPSTQGRGLGAALLRHMISLAEQQGVNTTLTTQDERSVEWYKIFDFVVTDKDTISLPNGDEMSTWCLVRHSPLHSS